MRLLNEQGRYGALEGFYDERFESVVEAFLTNFSTRKELGASCVVKIEGKSVVDIWGGKCPGSEVSWTKDTVCTVFSATKGASALCAHLLQDRNLLDLEAPIGTYWPEFADNGKEVALVKMALNHTLGVPHYREPIPAGGFYNYDYMVQRTEQEPIFWEPGTQLGYHAISMAWTLGEIVHRAASKRLGRFFNEEIAKRLGADFSIGDSRGVAGRVSAIALADAEENWLSSKFMKAVAKKDGSPASLFMRDFGLLEINEPVCHGAEVGSANGITNARGLANMYSPLANGGKHGETHFISRGAVDLMSEVSMESPEDRTLLIPTRFSLGFMLSTDNRELKDAVHSSAILGERAFGHVGAGGSIGFADPQCHMSFGYAMNKMGTGLMINERGQSLVDATYRSLGYSSNENGAWA